MVYVFTRLSYVQELNIHWYSVDKFTRCLAVSYGNAFPLKYINAIVLPTNWELKYSNQWQVIQIANVNFFYVSTDNWQHTIVFNIMFTLSLAFESVSFEIQDTSTNVLHLKLEEVWKYMSRAYRARLATATVRRWVNIT